MSDDHLMDVLTRRRPEPEKIRDSDVPDSLLPDVSKGYEHCARPSHHALYSLHFILGTDGYRSFQYVHLDSQSSLTTDGKGQVIRLRFCGSKVTAVTIRGRNLSRLYDYIHQHKIAWVMRMDRDFGTGNEPVVTAIDIEEVREPQPGQSP
jgi:hypothetical protein